RLPEVPRSYSRDISPRRGGRPQLLRRAAGGGDGSFVGIEAVVAVAVLPLAADPLDEGDAKGGGGIGTAGEPHALGDAGLFEKHAGALVHADEEKAEADVVEGLGFQARPAVVFFIDPQDAARLAEEACGQGAGLVAGAGLGVDDVAGAAVVGGFAG